MRFLFLFLIVTLYFGCKKKEVPKPPEKAALVFPANNSECITGTSSGPTTSMVEFKWKKALNTDNYQLRVTNVNTNTTQTISTRALSAKLPLEKGALYSWLVTTKNAAVLASAISQTWRFYNSGFQTAFAPFPAEIIAPEVGSSIFKDINNEVILKWSGSDLDDDIDAYEVLISTETPPTTSLGTFDATTTSKKVTVGSDVLYYWKVITKDKEGNTSDSGTFDFRTY